MGKRKKITYVYPYYENPNMFKFQQEEWKTYQYENGSFEVIVVDDCSKDHPAIENVIVPNTFPLKIYRINEKINWNWRAARNIGVYAADPSVWLLMTDMDHLVPKRTFDLLVQLLTKNLDENKFYTFDRVLAPEMILYKNHPNSYFLHRSLYLIVGGYDEIVSGYYGLDGVFRRRLERGSRGRKNLDGYNLVLYKREIIPDASLGASVMPRKEGRDLNKLQEIRTLIKERFKKGKRPLTLSFPYERMK